MHFDEAQLYMDSILEIAVIVDQLVGPSVGP